MEAGVLVTQLKITRAGQSKYFQVRLPKNTKQILGVETGLRLISSIEQGEVIALEKFQVSFKRNILVGELKLQSCEEGNIFYATQIQTEENLSSGDYSEIKNWKATLYTHQNKAEEDTAKVEGDSTILQGIYKDKIGEMRKEDMEYELSVYVWIETKGIEE